MRISLVTDAWAPQVNGVVRTLSTVMDIATARWHHVQVISPERFRSVPMPSYPEIRLALTTRRALARASATGAAVPASAMGPSADGRGLAGGPATGGLGTGDLAVGGATACCWGGLAAATVTGAGAAVTGL